MSRADAAFDRLSLAMLDTDPACQGDDRFILDDQPAHTLAYVCRKCPVYDLCAQYAELERPKAGIWAGKRYKSSKEQESEA